MDEDEWEEFERRHLSGRHEFLDFLESNQRIGYDDLSLLRRTRTYRFTEVEPKPEYL